MIETSLRSGATPASELRADLRGLRTASFWIDESGSKATASSCFVMAGLKTRHADDLQREIKAVRESTGYWHELKFGKMNATTFDTYVGVVDVLEKSDARLCATIVDGSGSNPFKEQEHWRAHAWIASKLIIGNMDHGEVATVQLDGITTPVGHSLGAAVKRGSNSRLGRVIVDAVSLDSKANDLLQLADLIAGSIYFERVTRGRERRNEHKARIGRRLRTAFDLEVFTDHRSQRVNIATLRPQRPKIVSQRRSAS